ncbi:dolichyl-phosphate beta-glucosyltransferase [Halobacteriovorax sp.]|uniref:dolichyl-phosphate beta-glucosyltransferase n=1 Tax=Halobacteriovorax sp. TaxID=2020862 RepID=UPI00356AB522
MSICLIIPCFNEESRLDIHSFKEHAKNNSNHHFLFVNDGSSDGTLKILEEISRDSSNIDYLDLKDNGGKAEAVRLGFLHSLKLGTFSEVGFWDADLATPLSELPYFEQVLNEKKYDIIMGSRVLRLGGHIDRKWYRHVLGRLFATVASITLKLPVYDTQCGAKFFKTDLVEKLFSEKFVSYWIFDVELLFRYCKIEKQASEKIYELPLNHWIDVEGSKLCTFDFLKAPLELRKIYKKYKG